jgi:GNAT superfamily N-acetyltransferase
MPAAGHAETASPETGEVQIRFVRNPDDFPPEATATDVARFLEGALQPFHDPRKDIARGISDALSPEPPGRGFVVLAMLEGSLAGALVMLRTGMTGYVPENLLLYVAVAPEHRGKGIGGRLCRQAMDAVDGEVKLHVEYENPARRLYERRGVESRYAEMRWSA